MTSRTTALLAGAAGFVFIIATQQAMAQTATLSVEATVVQNCTLTGGTLNFGTYVVGQASHKDNNTTIGYDCAAGLDIDVNLASANSFFMTGPSGVVDLLSYGLYQDDARTIPWGSNGTAFNISPTPGGGLVPLTVYGRIPSGQGVTAADYSDSVTVTISFN